MLDPILNDPIFLQNPTRNAPCFRSTVGTYPVTFIFSSAPSPGHEFLIFQNITYLIYSFSVDNFPPTITCAENINQNIPCGQTSTQVNFQATATDNCGTATVTYSSRGTTDFFSQRQSTATMNVGLSTITATATDTSGRTATCTTQVNINEGNFSVIHSFIFLSLIVNNSGNLVIKVRYVFLFKN